MRSRYAAWARKAGRSIAAVAGPLFTQAVIPMNEYGALRYALLLLLGVCIYYAPIWAPWLWKTVVASEGPAALNIPDPDPAGIPRRPKAKTAASPIDNRDTAADVWSVFNTDEVGVYEEEDIEDAAKSRILDLAEEILDFYRSREDDRPDPQDVIAQYVKQLRVGMAPQGNTYNDQTVGIFKVTYRARIAEAVGILQSAGVDISGLDIDSVKNSGMVYSFGFALRHRASKL